MDLLTAIFQNKPATDNILVWTLPGKRSEWYTAVEDIRPEHFDGNDTYFGLGTSAQARGSKARCPAAEVTGIGAIWLDVDIAGEAHRKGNLPPSEEQALAILSEAIPPPPSYIVHSGHGLQCYWLLHNWLPITDENRATVQATLRYHNTRWREACAARGLDADSVCDLARVMRMPGTTNYKIPTDPRTVTCQDIESPYYYGLDDFAPPEKPEAKPKTKKQAQAPALDPDKLDAFLENDPRARNAWDMKRPDLKDGSPSSLMMSLGRLAHLAGWTDAEVQSLMLQFRLQHGLDSKDHTIPLTLHTIKSTPSGFGPADTTPPANIEEIAQKIGVPIEALIRFDSTPPTYAADITDHSRLYFGQIDNLTDQRKFRNAIAAATGLWPPKQKPVAWDTTIRYLLTLVTHQSLGAESTDAGQCREWLETYLSSVTVHENQPDGLTAQEPWTVGAKTILTAAAFRNWIAIHTQERIAIKQLSLMLKSIGAEPSSVVTQTGGKRNTWILP